MLISQRLNRIDKALNDIVKDDKSELYGILYKDLLEIKDNLSKDIKDAEKRLTHRLLHESRDYQDATTEWTKEAIQTLKYNTMECLESKIDKDLIAINEALTKKIHDNIKEEVKEACKNVSDQIDIKEIVDNLKNSTDILDNIVNESVAHLKTEIDKVMPNLTDETKERLLEVMQSKIDLDNIIKIALDTHILDKDIQEDIKEKVENYVKEYAELKGIESDIKDSISKLEMGFLEFVNQSKIDLMTNANAKIKDMESYFNEVKDNVKALRDKHKSDLEIEKEAQIKAIQVIIAEFDNYLKQHRQEVLNDVFNALKDEFLNTMFENELMELLKEEGINLFLQDTTQIKEEVVNALIDNFLLNLSTEHILNFILNDDEVKDRLESLTLELLNEKLTHALIKDYVIKALKDYAKEILKSDELLRAEAEAQAHIVAMRLQSNLTSIQEAINALNTKQDFSNEIAELENKKQELDKKREQLQEALKEAKDELKKELSNTALSDKLRADIELIVKDELDLIKDSIKQEALLLITQAQDMHALILQEHEKDITSLKDLLKNLELKTSERLKELQDKIKTLDNANNGNNINIVDNKNLKFS